MKRRAPVCEVKRGLRRRLAVAAIGWVWAVVGIGPDVLGSHAEPSAGERAPRASVMRTPHGAFEVIGWDLQAVQVVTDLAAAVEGSAARAMGLRERFPTPVFVRLPAPLAGNASGANPVSLAVEPGGLVTLWLRLGPDLGERLATQALVRGWATRLAIFDGGFAEGLGPPPWLEAALMEVARANLEPMRLLQLAIEAERCGPWPLWEVLTATQADGVREGFRENAYLLLQFLRSESAGSGRWERMARGSLRGGDARVALAAWTGRAVGDAETELWWAVGFHHHRTRIAGPLRSPRASYRALLRASRVVLAVNGRDEALDWPRLWFWRDAPAVRSELAARARLLPVDAARAHPYFHDGYAALHDLYAAVLAGERTAFDAAQVRWAEAVAEGAAKTRAAEARSEGGLGREP